MSCLPVKYVEIGAKMNTRTTVTGIGYHGNPVSMDILVGREYYSFELLSQS